MFNAEPLVLSVPARELVNVPIPGSVFDTALLNGAALSSELRIALDLVTATYRSGGGTEPLRCVVRPEMFTHGESLNWLKGAVGSATQHLALSDGTSIKLIPHLRNHLFTYGLQSHQRHVDFQKLLRRAPELLAQCRSQLNSFHRVDHRGLVSEPAPSLMLRTAPLAAAAVWFHGFYLNPHSLEDSAEHMLNWGELEEPSLADFQKITYIPLTESAAHHRHYQRMVAALIAAAYFDPTQCLLIRLPALGSELTERMRIALAGLRDYALHLPRVRSRNIFFLSDDLSEGSLAPLGSRLSLLLHQSFEFWRFTRPLYQEVGEIVVCLDPERKNPSDSAKKLFLAAFGRTPQILTCHGAEGEWVAE